jgi:hypothetical protein
VGDVVAISEVGKDQTGELDLVLADREEVGKALAGVLEVRQGVDHGDVRRSGQRFEASLLERPDHDGLHVAGHDAPGVLDGLSSTQLEFARGENDGVSTQLVDRDLERDPRPGGGLLEDHRDGSACQRAGPVSGRGLQLGRALEEILQLGPGEVVDREEVPGHARSLSMGPIPAESR